MSNPTSSFGWQMPTPTDLVTDLPADFEVFGQAVDSTFADLKGGTTGQILSKATNTDMDFVWITNDQGDITAVNVTSPITGGGTSGAVTVGIQSASTSQSGAVQLSDSTSTTSSVLASTPTATKAAYDLANTANTTANAAIPKSTVTAKGSIVTATASSTPAQIAAGNNGEVLLADSSTSTGLRYQGSMAAGKNFVINGNWDIWQRSTSGTITGNGYPAADRWIVNVSAGGTSSRQTTGVPDGSQYCARNTFTSSSIINYYQLIETANVSQLWGKTVTFSMKIRRNSTLASNINIVIAKSATIDAGIGATWSNINATTILYTNLPTGTTSADWYTATVTATIPNDGTANSLYVGSSSGTQANGAYLEFAQAQLELGSVATAFSRAGGTIQGELAACQRYYAKSYNQATAPATNTAANGLVFVQSGATVAASAYFGAVNYPVTMRTTPTITIYSYTTSQTGRVSDGAGTDLAASSGAVNLASDSRFTMQNNSGGALTAATGGFVFHYTVNAEL